MNFREFRNKFKSFQDEWEVKRQTIPLEATITAISIAIDRVVNTGKSSTGSVFGVYKGSTQRSKKREKRTRSPFPNINFSDTNLMFKTTIPKVTKVTTEEVVISSEPSDPNRAKVMGYHNKRFASSKGKIVALNTTEKQNLINDYKDELLSTFKKYFK